MIEYQTEMTAKCPVDGTTDNYTVTITTNTMIPVETINKILSLYKDLTIYQEQLTVYLANILRAEIRTVGHHRNVKITATATPPSI